MDTITSAFTLGEPQVAGPLSVFPVFGPEPRLAYRAFAQATELGAFVKELDRGASVNDLLVENPTDLALLVFEGEEVLGAKQNRTFDVSVLVAAGIRVELPVSCVEARRWDPWPADETFDVAPQAAYPGLRRLKRARANARAAAGVAARPDQGEVWNEVGNRLALHGVESTSGALDDLYSERRPDLDELAKAITQVDGQLGALAEVGGRPVALDLVSRPDAFASLLPRLAQGYALDALVEPGDARPDRDAASGFLRAALDAPRLHLPTPGVGHGLAIGGDGVVGSGLEHEGELIQLSAFPAEDLPRESRHPAIAPIARPSRRRRRAA
jgi:hypothetical protein